MPRPPVCAVLAALVVLAFAPGAGAATSDGSVPTAPPSAVSSSDDDTDNGATGQPEEGTAPPAEADRNGDEDPLEFRVFWKDGLRMETEDGRFRFRFGGRIHNDTAFWGGNDALEARVGELDGGTEFRRARLFVQGLLYEHVEFKAQYDFAGGVAEFKDVYLGTRGLPADVRIGHFKEPFSLEELTSSKYITFLERALPNVFAPSRNTGVMIHGDAVDGRVSAAFGVFREADDFGFGTGGDVNVTGRLTGAPMFRDSGRRAIHLGVSLSYRNVDDGTLRFRQRPEVHLAPRFVDTGAFPADSAKLVALEGAAVYGPFSAQGEYVLATTDAPAVGDPTFDGYYLQASWWITGESRVYEPDDGTFGRVRPRRNFLSDDGGAGAWEVALRYSTLDLRDGAVDGGELGDVTLGVNWHWNPNVRLMFDLVHARVERDDLAREESVDAFEVRAQIDF